ncbi:ribosomal protein S18-alanine N-acetyltransferase [Actinacidiphila yeochonensis]|uniref:ribosomal protein S18-alanine N-acetyltransferase n=1 Tax=Actinacidiphila yeochonensis TaxID=89050 RepID=UPI000AEDA1E3
MGPGRRDRPGAGALPRGRLVARHVLVRTRRHPVPRGGPPLRRRRDSRERRDRRGTGAEAGAPPRIVGYAGFSAVAGTGDVQTIATARDQWGTGLGSRLLTELLRAATAAECHEVLLEVRVDNPRAQRLYRRFGFEPIGVRRGYYQPGNVDALVMRLADPARDYPLVEEG